jgi:hypothetical protein
MNRESFYVGLGMLFAPVLVYLVYLLIQSQIDWGTIGLSIIGISYFATALFLLIKGALSEDN